MGGGGIGEGKEEERRGEKEWQNGMRLSLKHNIIQRNIVYAN